MSQESLDWLNENTLIGYTRKRGTAWHYRKGSDNHYPGPVPIKTVRERLFNWEPVVGPVSTTVKIDGKSVKVTDKNRQVIVRPDTQAVLGVFKSGYKPHHYDEWLLHNVQMILDADLHIGSAGLLKGGAVAWVQIEMAETMEAAGVEFRPFLTAATSLDGSLATTYGQGAQVVVCDNTLQGALGSFSDSIKIRHSSRSLGKLSDVREALKVVIATGESFAAEIEQLAQTKVSEALWKDFVKAYTHTESKQKGAITMAENKQAKLIKLWNDDERVSPWKGTEYGVLAAVNTYSQHESIVRGKSRPERNAENMINGEWGRQDTKALDLLHSLRK